MLVEFDIVMSFMERVYLALRVGYIYLLSMQYRPGLEPRF